MARNPARPDHIGHVRRTDEEIRQLRIRPNLDKNARIIDLESYLYVYDPTPGANFEGWAPYNDGSNPFAGFHVTEGRCYLVGMLQWLGGTSNNGARGAHGNLSINSTPFPAYAWPDPQALLTVPLPQASNTWAPTPLGGSDGYYGAAVEIYMTTTGYLQLPNNFGNNYSGAARKASDSTLYGTSVPDGAVLSLDGISWAVAATD